MPWSSVTLPPSYSSQSFLFSRSGTYTSVT
jgi:hypothetical protein